MDYPMDILWTVRWTVYGHGRGWTEVWTANGLMDGCMDWWTYANQVYPQNVFHQSLILASFSRVSIVMDILWTTQWTVYGLVRGLFFPEFLKFLFLRI